MSNAKEDAGGAVTRPHEFLTTWNSGLGLSAAEGVLILLLCGMFGLAVATQVFADAFGYHPNLGAPLFPRDAVSPAEAWLACAFAVVGGVVSALRGGGAATLVPSLGFAAVCFAVARGPLYVPTEFVRWAFIDYRGMPEMGPALLRAWLGFGVGGLAAAVGLGVAFSGLGRRAASNSHGTAEWGSGEKFAIRKKEAAALKTAREQGEPAVLKSLVIGRLPDGRLLLERGRGHLITAAASQTGKGTGCVVPNLLLYGGSIINTDIKGENFFVTHRKRVAMGQEVFVLDPFGETTRMAGAGSKSLPYLASANPMQMIRTDREDAIDVARMIAGMLIPDEEGPNRHFSDEAKGFFGPLLLHVCYVYAHEPEGRTLLQARRMLTGGEEQFKQLLAEMAASPLRPVAAAAQELLQKEDRELSGTLSTMHRHTRFLDSPGMERVLGHGERMWDIETLKGDAVTVYLVLPPDRLKEYAGWVRVMIACCNSAVARSDVPPPRIPVLAMLDEAGQIGAIEQLETTVTLLTGYGMRVWFIFQDFSQMKKLYPKSFDTLFGAAEVRIMFGTGDMTTAELASKYAGEATIFTEGGSRGSSRSTRREGGFTRNAGDSVSERGRKLLLPDEVLRMGVEQQLVFVRGANPLLVDKVRFWRDADFRGDFDPNPLVLAPAA